MVRYFQSGHNTVIGDYNIFPLETQSKIGECRIPINTNQQIDFFTICYTLLHNTTKSKGYTNFNESKQKVITVNSYESDSNYIVEITNPGLIVEEISQIMNKEKVIDEEIIESRLLKLTNGLIISKKLCTKNNWHLRCRKANNTTIFKLTIVKTI